MRFSVFQVSRKGGRSNNEDRMGYCYTRDSAVFVLADGMGGHPQGEVAAQLALESIVELFQKTAVPRIEDVPVFLADALMTAHRQILGYADKRGMSDSPRTTVVVAVIQSGHVWWTHCGDSRLYWVRQGDLLTRTRDHSFVEQTNIHPAATVDPRRINRNALFTCLGSPTKPVFQIGPSMPLQQGDKLMLCSDGLWSSLSEAEIISELTCKAVDHAVPDMVELALRKAGDKSDNVTCIGFAWEMPDSPEVTPSESPATSTSDGMFASTVQSTWVDIPHADDLDDAAIERSITEINAAIRRSAEKKHDLKIDSKADSQTDPKAAPQAESLPMQPR
ncbi:PP2C family protein-serine/threonine phosphatase [Candidatus Symbiobacter mobilis]|uniref:Serine/threonine protein phosphatase n=1 Tax=Candidatus Symbiobacter mobilis CR TaxID=946483 RepID=U5N682_9BURK|nr:PP2C family serine/threonine-protein phosphatase [Candidatus Symbiobacter mobilis]AGX86857.1 serine/threonine protein phosphatase [Candidatus Symbiobacter mobilis CR]